MSDQPGQNPGGLEIEMARRIDAICRRFEADLREGRHPRVQDYLVDVADEGRPALRDELEALEHELHSSDETLARPEAGVPTFAGSHTAPNPRTIDEAPTIAPAATPTTPIRSAALSAVHDEATVLPSNPPGSPHDQPTAAVLGQGSSAITDGPAPSRIRYFGDYEIVREIARGGMGVVFQARQVRLNRTVALKMILAGQLADETDVKPFYTEAEAAANLDHPGIVPIYEVGQHEGQHYFSMGFVEGQSLSQRLAEGPLPSREAAELIRRVSEAIEYAHQRGVIHRDLKPANILLDRNGNPRVTDFGLAKKVQGDSGLTGSGQIMGTPSYMPPEQAGGKRGEVGPAADVYALGATLYALITGRPPFQAATAMDTVIQVVSDEPVPPRRLNPTVDLDIETICLKCLEKEPAKRFATAGALADELARFLAGEPILARPVGQTERAWRWCRRKPVVAGLAGGVALALALGTVVATCFAVRADQAARRAQEEKRFSDRRLYTAEMNLAQRAWQVGNMDLFQVRLRVHVPKFLDDPDPRGFEWFYLDRLRQLELRTLPEHIQLGRRVVYSPDGRTHAFDDEDGNVTLWDVASGWDAVSGRFFSLRGDGRAVDRPRLAYSPDSRTLATTSEDGTVKLWDTASGNEVRALSARAARLAYSPDGRTLAIATSFRTLQLWDPATGKIARGLGSASAWIFGLAYSSDGRSLASTGNDYAVQLWDTAAGKGVQALRVRTDQSTQSTAYEGAAYSPDGRTVAAGGSDSTVQLWETATGKEIRTLRGHAGIVTRVLYSPDCRTLATVSLDETVKLWDFATGKEIGTIRGHPVASLAPNVSFSPDGRTLASVGSDNTVQVRDTATGKAVRALRSRRGAADVSYSPDGRTLALVTKDRTVELWDANRTDEIVVLRGHTGTVAHVVYSPDGRTLASASGDKTVKLWDATTGKEVRALRGHAGAVLGVAYSPDGRTLATASGDKTVKLWDAANGNELRTLRWNFGFGGVFSGLAYSPDGRTLASVSEDNTVKLWDAATGKLVEMLRGHKSAVDCVAYSPDGRTIASAGADGTVKLWDADTRKEVPGKRQMEKTFRAVAGRAFNGIVAYSPDGRTLATTALSPRARADLGDYAVQLWDAAGHEVVALVGHVGAVYGLAFSPDGRRIATASADGTVKLWDTITGQEALTLRGHADEVNPAFGFANNIVLTLRGHANEINPAFGLAVNVVHKAVTLDGHADEINCVAFSPDGYQIACACADGTVKIWDARPLLPDVQTTREARSVVEFLLAQKVPPAEVMTRIRRDPTISEKVRQLALDLVKPGAHALVN